MISHSSSPKISVLMPCCNNAAYIEQAVRSVLGQVDVELELVIVDDASSDDSVRIIESIADDRVRLLRNDVNRGIAAVRNQLLAAARGDWISSLDGDDYYWSEHKLAHEWQLMRAVGDPAAVAYSDVQLVDAAGESMVLASRMAAPREGRIFQAMLDRRIMIPRDFLVSRELATGIGGFDEGLQIYEDWDYKLRLALKGRFVYTGQIGIGYRRHAAGLSHARGRLHRDQLARIRRKYCSQAHDGDPMKLLSLAQRVGKRMSGIRKRAA